MGCWKILGSGAEILMTPWAGVIFKTSHPSQDAGLSNHDPAWLYSDLPGSGTWDSCYRRQNRSFCLLDHRGICVERGQEGKSRGNETGSTKGGEGIRHTGGWKCQSTGYLPQNHADG